jgi:hypothetical protein
MADALRPPRPPQVIRTEDFKVWSRGLSPEQRARAVFGDESIVVRRQ